MKFLNKVLLVMTLAVSVISCDNQVLLQPENLRDTNFCSVQEVYARESIEFISDDYDDAFYYREPTELDILASSLNEYGVDYYDVCSSNVEVIKTADGYDIYNAKRECLGADYLVTSVIKANYKGEVISEEVIKVEADEGFNFYCNAIPVYDEAL